MLIEPHQGIIVTGAANGIGRATVMRALQLGAMVFATDRSFPEEFWDELGQTSPGKLRTHEGMLGEEHSVAEMLRLGRDFLGLRETSVIHCAGIYEVESSEAVSAEQWDRVLATNARLSFLVAKHFALGHTGGRAALVLLTSVAYARGDWAEPAAAYAASKGAIVSMTRQLATEWGPRGIRVNSVAPGVIDTSMTTLTLNENAYRQFIDTVPLRRMGRPSEVADVCLFLCGSSATYITGSVVTVDGGYLAS